MRVSVNAVAFQNEGRWIAQCLEYDIAISTSHLKDLRARFERAVVSSLCTNIELGREGFEGIPPAPAEFKVMFDKSQTVISSVVAADDALPVELCAMRLADPELSGDL